MKYLLALVFFSLLLLDLQAQPFGDPVEGFRIIRQAYTNSSGEVASTIFKYNRDNQLATGYWSLKDGSRYSQNYYEYDENGYLVSTIREFSEGRHSYEQFFYNQKGQKTNELFCRSDSIYGTASYRYENGLLVEASLDNFKGWLTLSITYQYDASSRRTGAKMSLKGRDAGSILYLYDELGNLVQETWDFNGKWSQTFSYFYAPENEKMNFYSSPYLSCPSSYKISNETYTFNNESGGPSSYEYNSRGELERKVFTRSDGFATSTLYTYDKEGRLVSSAREYNSGDEGIFRYQYDEDSHLIGRGFYLADTLAALETHQYDANGYLFKSYFRNFDGWLNGVVSYTPGHNGKPVKGIFKGENGFDAVLLFTYNNEGLLSELRWDFSFGKFQLYTFTYISTKL